MKVIEPGYEIMTNINGLAMLKRIERAGRTCYKSEDRITKDSAEKFVAMILERGHESVLEHESITVKFVTNRGMTHEEVRHRLCSYSQESSRFCNYSKDKFGNEITYIDTRYWDSHENSLILIDLWCQAFEYAEHFYFELINYGAKPEEARDVLPIGLKTEIVHTCNLRQWRLIFDQRCSKKAHPVIRKLMRALCKEFQEKIPVVFDDITW